MIIRFWWQSNSPFDFGSDWDSPLTDWPVNCIEIERRFYNRRLQYNTVQSSIKKLFLSRPSNGDKGSKFILSILKQGKDIRCFTSSTLDYLLDRLSSLITDVLDISPKSVWGSDELGKSHIKSNSKLTFFTSLWAISSINFRFSANFAVCGTAKPLIARRLGSCNGRQLSRVITSYLPNPGYHWLSRKICALQLL